MKNKIILSIKTRPINLVLILIVMFLYFCNNIFLKSNTTGMVHYFFISHFNDLICPLFFISYANILLISIGKELRKLRWIMLFGLCSGLVWEFWAPILKASSVTDILDLFFYLIGAFLYWCIINLYLFFKERRKFND